jgi:hypothetical protein
MALDILQSVGIIELMENYIERARPSIEIRDKLDIGYRIDNQSIILFTRRPFWQDPKKIIYSDYAKATFNKKNNVWKIYWMRASGKWNLYDPKPKASKLSDFLAEVDQDKYGCFKG